MTAHIPDARAVVRVAPAQRLMQSTRRFIPVAVLDLLMVIVFSVLQPVFFSAANLQNVLTSISIIWLVAMGMTFVLVGGGFDLSAGAIAAVAGIALAKLLAAGVPGGIAIVLATMLGGLIGGAVNGVLVGAVGLSVFVVTLGSMTTLTGVASLWTNTQTLPVTDPTIEGLVTGRLLGVPIVIWLMALVFAATLYLQRRTHFGRDVFAVGGSLPAARLSGIRTDRVLIGIYLFVGLCAGLGGVIAAGRIGGAAPQVDGTLPLLAIAAVLLGGTSLTGGVGSVVGTVFGVLFIGLLQNGLSLAGVQTFWQQVITGVILVAAVLGDRLHPLQRIRSRNRTPADGEPSRAATPAPPLTRSPE